MLTIPLRVDSASELPAGGEPVCFGVPLAKDIAFDRVWLISPRGEKTPCQFEVTATWANGTPKWVLVDVLFTEESTEGPWHLGLDEADLAGQNRQDSTLPMGLHESWRARGGVFQFDFDCSEVRPFKALSMIAEENATTVAQSRCVLIDANGREQIASAESILQVEAKGPVRTTVHATGKFKSVGNLRTSIRTSVFQDADLIRLDISLHNPQRARHPGGLWDLGDDGSIFFRGFSVEIDLLPDNDGQTVVWSTVYDAQPTSTTCGHWNLYQDSSGGKHWQSQNHVNRDGESTVRQRGYTLQLDDEVLNGLRAEPVLEVVAGRLRAQLAVPGFWQQFPKSIEVRDGRIRVGLFPLEFNNLFELQGGERKTHTIWLRFSGESSTPGSLAWAHRPTIVSPSKEWCMDAGFLPLLNLSPTPQLSQLDQLFREAVHGPQGILANREKVDEYGWRNFGDIFADHEEAYYKGDDQLISHYNNQYDMILGFLLQYLRTGERTWWELGDALARHVVDIDLYHTTEDKAAYNGGHFWLTDHYLHARTSTHRTYSRKNVPTNAPYGGGPGAEHNFTSGLWLHYQLTGNVQSKEAVLQLANWVVDMDDGRLTILGLIDDSPTGLATGSAEYQGPNRGGGFSINALLDAFCLTRQRTFIESAEQLICRCVHPEDDIERHQLLDVERRWSYTVFLTSIAKYLTVKQDADEFDVMYAYARASLLHYACWMLKHERPYFDQPEKLEYPTEAWAVQEFRKANVLRHAARYTSGDLQRQLTARGLELAERAWLDLNRFETRTYARALAVIMIEGLWDCFYRNPGVLTGLAEDCDSEFTFGSPQHFTPQKQKVKSDLKSIPGILKVMRGLLSVRRWQRYQNQKSK